MNSDYTDAMSELRIKLLNTSAELAATQRKLTETESELVSAHADIEREVGEWNSEVAAHEVTRRKLAEAEAAVLPAQKFLRLIKLDGRIYADHLDAAITATQTNGSEALTALLAAEREKLAAHFDAMPGREMFGGTIAAEIRSLK